MSIYEAVTPIALRQLLGEINTGASVLPDFQRDFVWDPAATRDLLISIACEFPAGSILRVRDTQNAFATRVFEGAPTDVAQHTFLILDGQQRLTSLYQAFFGTGDYRFFISLNQIADDDDLTKEDSIFYLRASRRGVLNKESDIAVHASEKILPLSVLFGRDGGFWKWASDVRKLLPDSEQNDFEVQMRELHSRWIENLESYSFPVVTLGASASTESLCTIFETLNKTGVKLSVFELLTARFWRFGINLREKWEQALIDHPLLEEYEVDPYSVLQAVSLVSTTRCQKRDVLNLTAQNMDDFWEKVLINMSYGLEIIRDDCKIMSRKWLPTPSMLGPLAAILTNSDSRRGVAVGQRRKQVAKWIWCSIFGQRYEAAANTRAEKDVADMKKWFAGESVPESISQFRFDIELLKEVSSKSSAVYKGVICLVLASGSGARDFHNGSLINQNMISTNYVDDHHIFPSDFLKVQKGIEKKSLRDCVLNRTLIDRTTNQVISNRAPSDYLTELQVGSTWEMTLGSHLIPIGENSPLFADDYQRFLQERSILIANEISKVTAQ